MTEQVSKIRHLTEVGSWSMFSRASALPVEQDGGVCFYDARAEEFYDLLQVSDAAKLQISDVAEFQISDSAKRKIMALEKVYSPLLE
jgi:hypothetical protein